MNIIHFDHKSCEEARKYLDSYLSNELLVETSRLVFKHLESCPGCSDELKARTQVRGLLQNAVRREVAPAALRERIQQEIHKRNSESRFATPWGYWSVAAAAVILFLLGSWAVLRVQILKNAPQLAQKQSPSELTGAILKLGLGDHVTCTLDEENWKKPLNSEEISREMGPEYVGLVPLTKEKIPDFELLVGHRCDVNGHNFVHLILKRQERIVSLILTRKNGESFPPNSQVAAFGAGEVPIYESQFDNLVVDGFESKDYFAFVVSNLDQKENVQIASNLAPAIREFFAH